MLAPAKATCCSAQRMQRQSSLLHADLSSVQLAVTVFACFRQTSGMRLHWQARAKRPLTKSADYVCEPYGSSALFLLNDLPKGVQHEEIAGEVVPGIVAEGGRYELPPLRIACVQV